MNSRKYYLGIVTRVLLIVLTALALSFLSFKTNYLYTILVMAVMIVLETWGLIRYILRRREDLKRMLEYIRENNPTLYFSRSSEYPFNELGDFMNEIGEIVKEVRIEKENQLQYMKYIVQHVGTGLLSFDSDGTIDIINQAAKDLLGVREINSILSLDALHHGLSDAIRKLKPGEQKVFAFRSAQHIRQLAMRVSIFKIGQKEIRLIALQDIKNELDEKEMDSWQKLIRVLTHEIINSVTPVTSLTSTIAGFFRKDGKALPASDLSDESIQEALTGLGYIEDRGKNLISFVSKFRSLTRLPSPRFETISMEKLLTSITLLKREELSSAGIALKHSTAEANLNICCDRSLIEHVLINLVNNASDALSDRVDGSDKIIEITGSSGLDGHPEISVKDNGTGIPDELIENIFIPFFTTKENGSGIGLSLARQIMKLHGGTISVLSKPGLQTVFTLTF